MFTVENPSDYIGQLLDRDEIQLVVGAVKPGCDNADHAAIDPFPRSKSTADWIAQAREAGCTSPLLRDGPVREWVDRIQGESDEEFVARAQAQATALEVKMDCPDCTPHE